jgi:hypothetical protein
MTITKLAGIELGVPVNVVDKTLPGRLNAEPGTKHDGGAAAPLGLGGRVAIKNE